MPLEAVLDVAMVVVTIGLLMAGYPVAFTLAGTALLFAGLGWLLGVFDFGLFGALPSRIFGTMENGVLLAVPLFIFMGIMLERSRVAEALLETMGALFGRMRGGLTVSVSVVGALMAASTGIVGATVVTMGLLSLPTMLRRGYDPALASGAIAASGTLGQVIPPSIILVLLGDQIATAWVNAQRAVGNYAPEPVSVGDLFAGALLPGLMLVGLYIGYQLLVAWLRPESSPPVPAESLDDTPGGAGLGGRVVRALVPPVLLIVVVLGSILTGLATPTEAAAVGAVGAVLLAGARLGGRSGPLILGGTLALAALLALAQTFDLRLARDTIPAADQYAIHAAFALCAVMAAGLLAALWRTARQGVLWDVMTATVRTTTMVFTILIGAGVFSLVFRGLGGEALVQGFLEDLPGGMIAATAVVMAVMFVLGFFLDFIEIMFVVVPMVAPVLLKMDMDPVWLGVLMAMNLQTSFLTPPFGFALFYLRGVAPHAVTTGHIYRGALPFVVIQIIGLALVAGFPGLATWLPGLIFG